MQNIGSERLQATLNYWKDFSWGLAISQRFLRLDTTLLPYAVSHAERFESLVFDNRVQELPQDWLLWTPDQLHCWKKEMIVHYASFPYEFFQWSRTSRRIIQLPTSLSRIFGLATFPNMKWEDVTFPYESFMITLEDPILVEERESGWFEYDTILVTNHGGGIMLRLFAKPKEEQPPFPEQKKRKAERLAVINPERGYAYLKRHWNPRMQHVNPAPGRRSGYARHPSTAPSEMLSLEPETIYKANIPGKEMTERTRWIAEPFSIAAKIVVGWCLYLESLTKTDISWSEERRQMPRRGARGFTGIITQTDHICTVLGDARMDPVYVRGEEVFAQNSGFFKRPHWRRAHKARERGSPPNTPKSVRVPARLIRKDLIPFFGIIGGTHTTVLEEE